MWMRQRPKAILQHSHRWFKVPLSWICSYNGYVSCTLVVFDVIILKIILRSSRLSTARRPRLCTPRLAITRRLPASTTRKLRITTTRCAFYILATTLLLVITSLLKTWRLKLIWVRQLQQIEVKECVDVTFGAVDSWFDGASLFVGCRISPIDGSFQLAAGECFGPEI